MADKNDWITPPEIITGATAVLGGRIDLDPMSSDKGNLIVCARSYFALPDRDAFKVPWSCRTLWLNPPYGRGVFDQSIRRFMDQWFTGAIGEAALVLTNNVTDTEAGQVLLRECEAVAFMPRLSFIDPDTMRPVQGNPRGQMLTYFGPDPDRFARWFGPKGVILRPDQA